VAHAHEFTCWYTATLPLLKSLSWGEAPQLLHIHKDETDQLDLAAIDNDCVSDSQHIM